MRTTLFVNFVRFAVAAVAALSFTAAHAGGNADAGKQKSQVCQSCHGADGNSDNPQFPRLAGQHADYLLKALQDYKSSARKNPIMAGFVGNLSEQDMEDLAAYYARQKGLSVNPR